MAPDRKRIVSAYTSSNRTIGEISKLVGVGPKLVSRCLREHGITQEDIRKRANSGKLAPEAKLEEALNFFQATEMLMAEIAFKVGVSENTIRKHLLNRGISEEQMRRRWLNNRRVSSDKREQVVELYNSSDLTITDVAKATGISTPTIKKYLKESGITAEQIKERGVNKVTGLIRSREVITPEETKEKMLQAKQLYLETDLSCPKIAERLNVGVNTALTYLKKQGIDTSTMRWKKLSKTNTGKKQSPETIAKQIAKRIGTKKTFETKQKISEGNTNQLIDYQRKHTFFCKVESVRDNPHGIGIQVTCKKCGDWFTPTRGQISRRIAALERPDGNDGHYFYCSDECRGQCPVYKLRTDTTIVPFTTGDLAIWSKHVISRDKECLYCGSTKRLQAHHINPKSTHPKEALDPANGITVCKDCHGRIHNGECSAAYLAAIAC